MITAKEQIVAWEAIRKRGSECPLCRRPVDLEEYDHDHGVYLRVSEHAYPSMVSATTMNGMLHYPALHRQHPLVGDLTYEARCPMSHAPVTLCEKTS